MLLGTYDYTGGVLSGYDKDPSVDEYLRKEHLRKNRRRPIQETLDELGEGRGTTSQELIFCRHVTDWNLGIYGPGYAERRRERIKQNYGIDVPASFPNQP